MASTQKNTLYEPVTIILCFLFKELLYTNDGVVPAIFTIQQSMIPGDVVQTPLFMGAIYRFDITWPQHGFLHSFTVTEYEDKLHVYRHTFKPAVKAKVLFYVRRSASIGCTFLCICSM